MERPFDPTATAAWQRLAGHARALAERRIADLFAADPARAERYSLEVAGIFLDYSKNLVTDGVLADLFALAEAAQLDAWRQALFRGEPINESEGRAVLHPALRATAADLEADGLAALAGPLAAQREAFLAAAEAVRTGTWRGVTGAPFRDLVHLGIGGSELGPKLVWEALGEGRAQGPRLHFVANADGEALPAVLAGLDPARTLVVVVSKSFTTPETALNAELAARWLADGLGLREPTASPHFTAVTAADERARAQGYAPERIFAFPEGVGGRFSLWSAVGFSLAAALGRAPFEALLAGARAMDRHFREAPLGRNLPVLLASLGVWYNAFFGAAVRAVVPYGERLRRLPEHLQQLEMESNGKGVTRDGRPVHWPTGQVVLGGVGTAAQHSFFQLLHQGTRFVPVDLIGVVESSGADLRQRRFLLANLIAQARALMSGDSDPALPPHRRQPGNRPSNVLLLTRLAPETLGALIALYEHRVFVEGVLLGINSFDQWGVELGKRLARQLLAGEESESWDPSTRALLARLPGG
ncbi:MAG: glucose-6-phosphate isomerase [Porticoccaceae bacterium]|nr:MAG: glucose-6-phosphate isomerase [Porticoccaceae bacterium]